MAKRAREGSDDGEERISKRSKPWSVDRLSSLSDELLLKVLSYLPISQLVVVGRYVHSLSLCFGHCFSLEGR